MQIALYLIAIAAAIAAGQLDAAPRLAVLINPALMLLLFATFLGVPISQIHTSLRGTRFPLTIATTNFVVIAPIVWALSRFVADDPGLLLGLLMVLLTPCVDYVIIFTGLAGGDRARLLAATLILMAAQMLLLPPLLLAFCGS